MKDLAWDIDVSTGVADETYIEAVFENEAFFEIARLLDLRSRRDPTKGGRRRMFPTWAMLLYQLLVWVWGSARHVDAQLRHPANWDRLRKQALVKFPDQPEMQLPESSIRRHHWTYFQREYLKNPAIQDRLWAAAREVTAAQAVEIGLLDPSGPGSLTHPDRSRSRNQGRYSPRSSWETGAVDDQLPKEGPGEDPR